MNIMNRYTHQAGERSLGVVGGLGDLAGVDLLAKLVSNPAVQGARDQYHFILQQDPFKGSALPLASNANLSSRMFYVFQTCQALARRSADAVLLPCFASHTFLEQLQDELDIPVIDMMAALRQHVSETLGDGGRLGVVCSDFVRHAGLFERYFGDRYTIVYPRAEHQATLMDALYGAAGIKAGHLDGEPLAQVRRACLDLREQGVDLLLPGATELSLVAPLLQQQGLPLLDANRLYADFATRGGEISRALPFKLGVVGGVGPAATVDFMGKVVRNTPASRDQDHIKMIVEQNPQIPDRTANLLRNEADPSIALYATCKRLEEEGAGAIAIPCNTAHAFVERIQPLLSIPVIHMLDETVKHVRDRYGVAAHVGLLATAGTVQSGVYQQAAERVGLQLMTPNAEFQARVMRSIYGERGIKAGFVEGECREDLLAAAQHLAEQGATILILGCTELPLVLRQADAFSLGAYTVALVDPTEVLAQRCVAIATAS
ncbi:MULTISPECIES: aspartate/glutamate racemase family protein [Pseudomonas]|uniref:Aspartate/glutamate racemase family protein n=1 Tax=Pseudomonas quercus TaxID=2722792 RepID=A0ABX0YBK6_9PSED|nr:MULTISPECIES: amino acid racemase [Pseudomonas]MBF7142213.1 aspartate/glutamate racemase family protein [Pseudomonas sp. LY10J]NJP00751.1 aspartate/glutamate racemase family protein [Pseudomonas quercus]